MIEIVKAEPTLEIKVKLDEGARMPEKAHDADAGFDMFSPCDCIVPATKLATKTDYFKTDSEIIGKDYKDVSIGSSTIDTGVHMAIPFGYVGMIKSKSGLNVKHGLTAERVVDSGYTGSIKVKLYNHSDTPYEIHKGDKITQLVILPVPFVKLSLVDSLEETERGAGGFGSTGR